MYAGEKKGGAYSPFNSHELTGIGRHTFKKINCIWGLAGGLFFLDFRDHDIVWRQLVTNCQMAELTT